MVFIGALVSFTPTNVAILAVLAGFLGGCASLHMYSNSTAPRVPAGIATADGSHMGKAARLPRRAREFDEERLAYLTENPIISGLRGLIAYLAILAGIVIGSNDPFVDTTPAQYVRLAGTIAMLAFTVGYDPSVLKGFLSALPNRAKPSPSDLNGGNGWKGQPGRERVTELVARE